MSKNNSSKNIILSPSNINIDDNNINYENKNIFQRNLLNFSKDRKEKELYNKTGIKEVYQDNFIEEIKNIGILIDKYNYNYIGMDTEFPGIVYKIKYPTQYFYFCALKANVDSLKLIQLGITLTNEKGEYPVNYHTWQFNLKFDKNKDAINPDSLSLLEESGIDFDELKNRGINHKLFAEYFMISGLILNPAVTWISFHGSYDFAYLLRLLLNNNLPNTEKEFMELLDIYFINYYDIRTLVKGNNILQGSLDKLAKILGVSREGKKHQAGSDSCVTIDLYFKLINNGFIEKEQIINNKNILFGINSEEDNKETINYTINFTNNIPDNSIYTRIQNNFVNVPYFYIMTNNNLIKSQISA